MANDGKYLNLTGGLPAQESAVNTAAGAGDANKIARLDSTGKWDPSMMPVGVVPEVLTVTASEAISAGDWVNLWNSTGLKARKADATVAGKEAHGFALAAISNGATGSIYLEGLNTQVTGKTAGDRQFLSTTAGASTTTAPSGAGNQAQVLGVAVSATSISFKPSDPITVA
jgi:hypothetical protein